MSLDSYLGKGYEPHGGIQTLPDGLQFYAVGGAESKRVIVFLSDLFGWNTGHIRPLADYLANIGYYVVIPRLLYPTSLSEKEEDEEEPHFPNLFDFSHLTEYMKTLAYDKVARPKILHLLHYLEHCGVKKIGILSFSWGSWVGAHVLSDPSLANKFTCGIMIHPSINLEERIYGGNVADLMNNIQKPLLIVSCKGDPNEFHEGGVYFEPLRNRLPSSKATELPHVDHGFFPRGRIYYRANYVAIHKVMTETIEFFNAHSTDLLTADKL